jgi:hypothetical protein
VSHIYRVDPAPMAFRQNDQKCHRVRPESSQQLYRCCRFLAAPQRTKCRGSVPARCGTSRSESRGRPGQDRDADDRSRSLHNSRGAICCANSRWQNGQRPLTSKPPSITFASPPGVYDPAPRRSGPSAYSASKRWRGSKASSITPSAPIITVQPVDPSARASASRISSPGGKSVSSPPWLRGTNIRKHPAAMRSRRRSSGSSRAASISAARAVIDGASS